jgi:hypothetical protein
MSRWPTLDDALAGTSPEPVSSVTTATPRKCRRHGWVTGQVGTIDGYPEYGDVCRRCWAVKDPIRSRRSRNNGKRGRAAELTAARQVGGQKVGPLGHPWDVVMPGYARIQVRKYQTPQGLRAIAAELARIAAAPGPEMPGYMWIEPGRGGERLIVFRVKDFADRHGTPTDSPQDGPSAPEDAEVPL